MSPTEEQQQEHQTIVHHGQVKEETKKGYSLAGTGIMVTE